MISISSHIRKLATAVIGYYNNDPVLIKLRAIRKSLVDSEQKKTGLQDREHWTQAFASLNQLQNFFDTKAQKSESEPLGYGAKWEPDWNKARENMADALNFYTKTIKLLQSPVKDSITPLKAKIDFDILLDSLDGLIANYENGLIKAIKKASKLVFLSDLVKNQANRIKLAADITVETIEDITNDLKTILESKSNFKSEKDNPLVLAPKAKAKLSRGSFNFTNVKDVNDVLQTIYHAVDVANKAHLKSKPSSKDIIQMSPSESAQYAPQVQLVAFEDQIRRDGGDRLKKFSCPSDGKDFDTAQKDALEALDKVTEAVEISMVVKAS